jgi:hypothetical protein
MIETALSCIAYPVVVLMYLFYSNKLLATYVSVDSQSNNQILISSEDKLYRHTANYRE